LPFYFYLLPSFCLLLIANRYKIKNPLPSTLLAAGSGENFLRSSLSRFLTREPSSQRFMARLRAMMKPSVGVMSPVHLHNKHERFKEKFIQEARMACQTKRIDSLAHLLIELMNK